MLSYLCQDASSSLLILLSVQQQIAGVAIKIELLSCGTFHNLEAGAKLNERLGLSSDHFGCATLLVRVKTGLESRHRLFIEQGDHCSLCSGAQYICRGWRWRRKSVEDVEKRVIVELGLILLLDRF